MKLSNTLLQQMDRFAASCSMSADQRERLESLMVAAMLDAVAQTQKPRRRHQLWVRAYQSISTAMILTADAPFRDDPVFRPSRPHNSPEYEWLDPKPKLHGEYDE